VIGGTEADELAVCRGFRLDCPSIRMPRWVESGDLAITADHHERIEKRLHLARTRRMDEIAPQNHAAQRLAHRLLSTTRFSNQTTMEKAVSVVTVASTTICHTRMNWNRL